MKSNVLKSLHGKRKQRMLISKAISRFISNTQKIVQKVKPQAQIMIRKQSVYKKKPVRVSTPRQLTPKALASRVIHVPDFHGK